MRAWIDVIADMRGDDLPAVNFPWNAVRRRGRYRPAIQPRHDRPEKPRRGKFRGRQSPRRFVSSPSFWSSVMKPRRRGRSRG